VQVGLNFEIHNALGAFGFLAPIGQVSGDGLLKVVIS